MAASSSFIERLRALDLPASELVVIGSGLLDALGIRPAVDIDLVVSPACFGRLAAMGWQPHTKGDEPYYTKGDGEVWLSWDNADGRPNFADLRADNNVIDGYTFVSLERLYAWKAAQRRPKDVPDLALIEAYQEAN